MAENEGGLLTADNPVVEGTDIFASVPKEVRFSAEGNDKLARFTDAASLANSYLELEKMDSGKIKMPTDASTAEEKSAFYQKLGRPDNVEGYGQLQGENLSDGDKAYYGAIANAAHAKGIPTEAFQGMIQAHNEYQDAKMNADTNATEELLQGEWSGDYDKNLEIVERVFRETEGGTDFKSWFNSVGGGRNAMALKWILEQGKTTMDDTFVKGDPPKKAEVGDYVPKYVNSPSMYKNDESEEGVKARAFFAAKGIEV